jgi:hypothetical protein
LSSGQPRAFFVARTASAPGASEWALRVPAVGIPKPMVVLTEMSEGRSATPCASRIALSIAARSFPSSTVSVCQP